MKKQLEVQDKQIALKQQNLAMAATQRQEFAEEFGGEVVNAKDIKIRGLILMQAASDLVKIHKKFKDGDIITTDHELLAAQGETIRFSIFSLHKTLRTVEVVGTKDKWLKDEPLTKLNENLPWAGDFIDGKPVKRFYLSNFYAILEKEVEKTSDEELARGAGPIPVKITLGKGSFEASKSMLSDWNILISKSIKPYNVTFELKSLLHTNKKNSETYNIFTVRALETESSDKMKSACGFWRKNIIARKNDIVEDTSMNHENEETVVSARTDEY